VNTQGARISHLTMVGRFVYGPMPLTLVTPGGSGAHRPLLVFLHGAVYDNNSELTNEVIPKALTVLGADPRRVAIGGISMGGLGAYTLARQEPGRFCAVGGHSAAISPTYDATASTERAPLTTRATSPATT